MKNAILPTVILVTGTLFLSWHELVALQQSPAIKKVEIVAQDTDSTDLVTEPFSNTNDSLFNEEDEKRLKKIAIKHSTLDSDPLASLRKDQAFVSLSALEQSFTQKLLFKTLAKKAPNRALSIGESILDDNKDASIRFNLALAYRKTGNIEQAVAHYNQLIMDFPEHQAGIINLGMLYKKQKKWLQAENTLNRAVEISNGKKKAKALSLLGSVYLKQGRYEQALDKFRKSIQYRPDNAGTWFLFAETKQNLNHLYSEVLTTYQRASNLAPSDYKVLTKLGEYQLENLEFVDASKNFLKAVELSPYNLGAHRGLAWSYTEMKAYGNAQKIWMWLEKNEKTSARVKFAKFAQQAIEYMSNLSEGSQTTELPEFSPAKPVQSDLEYINLILAETRSNVLVKPQESCTNPGKPLESLSNRSLFMRAKCALNQKNTDNADKLLAVLEGKLSNNGEVRFLQGLARNLSGDYSAADQLFFSASQSYPERTEIVIERIKNLISAKNLNLASELLSKTQIKSGKSPELIALAAEIAWIKQDWTAAQAAYKQLIMWESEETESRFRLAYATLKNGNSLVAKQDLKELLSIDAGHIDGRVLLAQLHCNNGQITECHLEAKRVLKLDKNNRLAKTLINQSNKSKHES